MNKKMVSLITLLIIGSLIGATGQVFLKSGLQEIGSIDIKLGTVFNTTLKLMTNKYIILGILLSAFAAFFWLVAISKINLSIGSPIAGGLFYVSVITLSIFFLKEKIGYIQFLGICITLAGIIILAKFGR